LVRSPAWCIARSRASAAPRVPDAKTMGKWGPVVGPQVVGQLHERLVAMARAERVMEGRRMRVDTTVVDTNIHYPTDSSLLGDGVRVLTRAMRKVTAIAGAVGATLRDRRRSVNRRLMEIGRIARSKGAQRQEKLTRAYQRLFAVTSRVVGQAKRFAQEIRTGVKRTADVRQHIALEGLREELDTFVPRIQQVLRQARARFLARDQPQDQPAPTIRLWRTTSAAIFIRLEVFASAVQHSWSCV
jgi:IS5 family transposase